MVIGPPTAGEQDAGRVSAQVAGQALWFECDDAPLDPAPEAWVSALLIPSLHRRQRLVSEAPLSAGWLENLERLLGVLA